MNRCVLALAGLLALPVCAAAQTGGGVYTTEPHPQQLPQSRFGITPFVGARLPFSTGAYYVFTEDGGQFRVDQDREGGYALGLNAEARLNRTLGLIAGIAYTGAAQDISQVTSSSGNADSLQIDGPTFWFAKAGVSVRLPDPVRDTRRFHPSALITVAPALVITNYADVDGFPELSESSAHFALNLGADAMARLGRGNWAITLGLEDYITFWNEDKIIDRESFIWREISEGEVDLDLDYGTSNIFLLRFGVSYRR
jgi:hypothetical protein